MSLDRIVDCIQTYGHQAYDDCAAFYLGRYTVRDDGATLSVASDDWCAERNGGVWHYRGLLNGSSKSSAKTAFRHRITQSNKHMISSMHQR